MANRVKHLKKDDLVIALSGAAKGKTGKVVAVKQTKGLIQVDGMGTAKRHTKPSQKNPKGGIVEKLRWWPASKFQVAGANGKGLGRVNFKVEGKEKTRAFGGAKKA